MEDIGMLSYILELSSFFTAPFFVKALSYYLQISLCLGTYLHHMYCNIGSPRCHETS